MKNGKKWGKINNKNKVEALEINKVSYVRNSTK
jgi:hypothetical protein